MGSTLLLLLLSLSLVVLLPTSNGEAILYAVSRGKAVKDNDLRCNQLASDGRRIEPFCYEVCCGTNCSRLCSTVERH